MIRDNIVLGLLALAYVFNSNIIEHIYPNAMNDYNEFLRYYSLRNQVYELMFFLFFLFGYFKTKGAIKAICTFLIFISFASVLDKIILNIFQFKVTDWVIIGAGLLGAIYTYKNDHKNRQ